MVEPGTNCIRSALENAVLHGVLWFRWCRN